MQSIQIESGSMYNTTSKRLNYKQLDPIDAQAAKKGRSRGSLAAEQHEGQSLDTQLPISEARDARAIVEWEKGSRGSRRRRPATAVARCWWPYAADPPLAPRARPTMGLRQGRAMWAEGSRSSGEQASALDRRVGVCGRVELPGARCRVRRPNGIE